MDEWSSKNYQATLGMWTKKAYMSDVVDIIIVALAEVGSVKLTGYNTDVYYEMQSITKSLANM